MSTETHAHRGPEDGAQHFLKGFKDPQAVAKYAEGPRRFVPAVDALHRMTTILLAERAPRDARILVLGAGGGMELKAMADAQPGWTFAGIDPARPMLDLAAHTLGPDAPRADLVEGYIEDAPPGPFDAGVCLLTLHFLGAPERLRTLGEIRRRLKPGAPFVAAHSSFPMQGAARARWLDRYFAFAVASGADPGQTRSARAAIDASLNMLNPEEDEALLRDAGFTDIELFYAAFTWRGWVAYT